MEGIFTYGRFLGEGSDDRELAFHQTKFQPLLSHKFFPKLNSLVSKFSIRLWVCAEYYLAEYFAEYLAKYFSQIHIRWNTTTNSKLKLKVHLLKQDLESNFVPVCRLPRPRSLDVPVRARVVQRGAWGAIVVLRRPLIAVKTLPCVCRRRW